MSDTERDGDGDSLPTWEKKSVTIDSLSRRELRKIEDCLESDVVPVGRSISIRLSTEYAHRDTDFMDQLQSAVLDRMDAAPTPSDTRRWERLYDKIPSEYDRETPGPDTTEVKQ